MGNYCNGSIYCTGDKDTLQLLNVLTQRLDDCAAISKIDGDTDLLTHIFKEEYSSEGIFYEGGGFEGETLELYIRASRTTGVDYFQQMASGLGITIKWQYVDDYDGKEHTKTCKPKKDAPVWELRSEEELDATRASRPQQGSAYGGVNSGFLGSTETQGSYTYGSAGSLSRLNLGGGKVRDLVRHAEYTERSNHLQDITDSVGTTDRDEIDRLKESVYFHCFTAFSMAKNLRDAPSFLQRTRITADMYMAASDMDALAGLTLGTSLLELTTVASQIHAVFGVSAKEMKFNFIPRSSVDYATVKQLSDTIIHLALRVMPDYAVMMSGLPIPYGLW